MTNTTEDRPQTIDHAAIVARYFTAWNTTDAAGRVAAVEAAYAENAHISDPLIAATGHEQLAAVFTQFHEAYAGCQFRQKGDIDVHHDLMRWGWEMFDTEGNMLLDGLDVGLVDSDGRLSYVAGFFGLTLPGT
jgi:hypothetical protein